MTKVVGFQLGFFVKRPFAKQVKGGFRRFRQIVAELPHLFIRTCLQSEKEPVREACDRRRVGFMYLQFLKYDRR